jgi:hypothetical protein
MRFRGVVDGVRHPELMPGSSLATADSGIVRRLEECRAIREATQGDESDHAGYQSQARSATGYRPGCHGVPCDFAHHPNYTVGLYLYVSPQARAVN